MVVRCSWLMNTSISSDRNTGRYDPGVNFLARGRPYWISFRFFTQSARRPNGMHSCPTGGLLYFATRSHSYCNSDIRALRAVLYKLLLSPLLLQLPFGV